jgi:hypothetical protein
MKVLTLITTLIASTNLFAIGDCIQFPIMNKKIEKYNGKITDQDHDMVYGRCPRTVMVNDSWVAHLVKIGDQSAENVCIYRLLNNVTFACKN